MRRITTLLLLFVTCSVAAQVPQTINAWYNYSPNSSRIKMNIGSPSTFGGIPAFWNDPFFSWRGQTVQWQMDTTSAFFGSPWSRSGFIMKTKFPGIATNSNPGLFGDSTLGGWTFHFGNIVGQKFVAATEFWLVDTLGNFALPFQMYAAGHHAAGYFKYQTDLAYQALAIGYGFGSTQFDNENGTFKVDAHSEPFHFHNMPSTTDRSTIVPLVMKGDSVFKAASLYPVWYKEDNVTPGPNNYVVDAASTKSVAVGGDASVIHNAINSMIVGGNSNDVWGNNSFGVGDNAAIIGGFSNHDSSVDGVIIGGDDNLIQQFTAGCVIIGGGQNKILRPAFNASIIASGFSRITGNGSAGAIVGGGAGVATMVADTVDANGAVTIGCSGCMSASYGEVNMGAFNTSYTPASKTAAAPGDRSFNIGNGTSAGAKSDAFTVTKNGYVGIGNVAAPVSSLILNVNSTTRAFAPPRMTTVQKLAIASPVEGAQVYDLTLHQMSYFNGTTWINF